MAKTVYMSSEFSDDLEKIRSENTNCQNMLTSLLHENECLLEKFSLDKKQKYDLQTNISSLYKTAISEIARKDKEIARLKTEIDNIVFRRDSNTNRSNNVNHLTSRNSLNERSDRKITSDNLSIVDRTAQSILKDANNIKEKCPKSPNYGHSSTQVGGSNNSLKDVTKRTERPASLSVVDERKIKYTGSYSSDSIDDERFKRTASEFEKEYYEMEKSLHLGHNKRKRLNSPAPASRNSRDRQSQAQKNSNWDLRSERSHPHSRSRSRERYRRSQEGSRRYLRDRDDHTKDLWINEREKNFNSHSMIPSRRSNEHSKSVETDCSATPSNKSGPTLNVIINDIDKDYIKTDYIEKSEIKECHTDEPSKTMQKLTKNDSESYTSKSGSNDILSGNHNFLSDDLEEGEISINADSNVTLKETVISPKNKVTKNCNRKNDISLNLEIKDKEVSPSHIDCKTKVERNDKNISKFNEIIKINKNSNLIDKKFEKSHSTTTESNPLFNKMNNRQNDISPNSQIISEAKNDNIRLPNNKSKFDTDNNSLKDEKKLDRKNSHRIEADLPKDNIKHIPSTLGKSKSTKNLIHTLFDDETINIGFQRENKINTLFSNKQINNVHISLPYETKKKDINNVNDEKCTASQQIDLKSPIKRNIEVDKNKLVKKTQRKDEYIHTEPPKLDSNQIICNIPGGVTSSSKDKQSKESHNTSHTHSSKAKHSRLKSLKFDFNDKKSENVIKTSDYKSEVSPKKKDNLSNNSLKQSTEYKEHRNYTLLKTSAKNTSEIKQNKEATNPAEKNMTGDKDTSSYLPITLEKSSENNQVKQISSEKKTLAQNLVINNEISQCIETKNKLNKTSEDEKISNSNVCTAIKENENNLPIIDKSKNITTSIVNPTSIINPTSTTVNPTTNIVNPTTIHFKVHRKKSTIVKKVK